MGEISNTSISFSFCKEERLCSKTLIEALFKSKFVIKSYPYIFSVLKTELKCDFPAQVLVVVSKKKHAKATSRNAIKRLSREAYRHHKHLLYECLVKNNVTCAFGLTYIASEKLPAADLFKAMSKIVTKLDEALSKPAC
ncbi:MAG: ribonuclease P protein component [Bacteroidia bacterium]|nr:ribonuclease P protein component [Bacteroidia bacterium]